MGALRKGLLIGFLLAQLVPAAHIACTQTSRSLQNRIPKPDPKKYRSVQDAKDWKNPYLIVRPDGKLQKINMKKPDRVLAPATK